MFWEQPIQYASRTDIGFRRRNNQDSLAIHICSEAPAWRERGHFFLVADGMGGHAVGELASKIAVDTIPLTLYKDQRPSATALKAAIESGNEAIHKRGSQNQDFLQMGTTCTALLLGPEGAWAGHVGDSRLYRIRRGRIEQLTFDHSLQWELIRQGKIPKEDVLKYHPRNVITRSLGPEENVQTDIEGPFEVAAGDAFVLCSDGLTNHLQDEEIGAIVATLPVDDACRFLVNLANLRGGSDNITVIVVRAGEVPEGAERPSISQTVGHEPNRWVSLIVGWIAAALALLGFALVQHGDTIPGVVAIFLGLSTAISLLVRRLRRGNSPSVTEALDKPKQTSSSPYRKASAKLTREFLAQIEKLEATLQRTAVDEAWELEWDKQREEIRAAQAAVEANNHAKALACYAKAIDHLMAWLLRSRKERSRQEKWGSTTEATSPTTD